jgi:hypothetical protein
MLIISDWAIAAHWQSATKPIANTSSNTCVRVGELISVQGRVQLKRKGWLKYHPINAGVVLCRGDLLQPAKESRVIVKCADLEQNSWIVAQGVPSGAAMGCHFPDEPTFTITGPIIPTRN